MGNLISFMKEVANGLRESGNYGTAHIYRSSMSAVISFHGSDKLPFRKVTQEFLKSFESYLRGRNCSWNTVSTYMGTLRAVYTGRSTAILRLMCPITSGIFIQERARTGNVHSIRKIWNV